MEPGKVASSTRVALMPGTGMDTESGCGAPDAWGVDQTPLPLSRRLRDMRSARRRASSARTFAALGLDSEPPLVILSPSPGRERAADPGTEPCISSSKDSGLSGVGGCLVDCDSPPSSDAMEAAVDALPPPACLDILSTALHGPLTHTGATQAQSRPNARSPCGLVNKIAKAGQIFDDSMSHCALHSTHKRSVRDCEPDAGRRRRRGRG